MNALELADMLESLTRSTPYKRLEDAAVMIRRQHEAIKVLREALNSVIYRGDTLEAWDEANAALAATENL